MFLPIESNNFGQFFFSNFFFFQKDLFLRCIVFFLQILAVLDTFWGIFLFNDLFSFVVRGGTCGFPNPYVSFHVKGNKLFIVCLNNICKTEKKYFFWKSHSLTQSITLWMALKRWNVWKYNAFNRGRSMVKSISFYALFWHKCIIII